MAKARLSWEIFGFFSRLTKLQVNTLESNSATLLLSSQKVLYDTYQYLSLAFQQASRSAFFKNFSSLAFSPDIPKNIFGIFM